MSFWAKPESEGYGACDDDEEVDAVDIIKLQKKTRQGIRRRWMTSSIGTVLLIVLFAITAFSVALGSYYYTTMSSRLQGRRFQGKILLLTGYADFRYAQQAVRYGITEYILKPIVPDEFLPLLQRYLRETEREKQRNERKNPRVSYLFSDVDDEALGEQISYMQYTECFFAILYISGDSHLPIQMKEMLLKEKDLYMAYLPDKQYRGICHAESRCG